MCEIGTLKELNVQPGDVVEYYSGSPFHEMRVGTRFKVSEDGLRVEGLNDIGYNSVKSSAWKYRLISRASDTPKLWRDMTPEEKGALLLAMHDGKKVEVYEDGKWLKKTLMTFTSGNAYRVKPKPKMEIENVKIINADGVTIGTGTVTTTNGKPDCTSIKMEKL